MNTLRDAAQQALEALKLARLNGKNGLYPGELEEVAATIAALEAALAEPETQSTHSTDCYKWHHKCAIAEVERRRAIERAHGIGGAT